MKKLGIIGGAGPLASALLYESLVQQCYCQNLSVPEMVVLNFPFTRGLSLKEGEENEKRIKAELQMTVHTLVQSRADIALLCCNTLHSYLPALEPLQIPFFHIPLTLKRIALQEGNCRLLILATQNSRSKQIYHGEGICPIYPDSCGQSRVDRVIDNILSGTLCKEDSIHLTRLIEQISKEEQVEGVVLGCTDLPVLHHHFPIECPVALYDSIKLPAKKIIRGLL